MSIFSPFLLEYRSRWHTYISAFFCLISLAISHMVSAFSLSIYPPYLSELEEFLTTARGQLATAKEEASNADKFIAMLHKYTDFSGLATPMIHEFIERIEVHEADKSTGERTQEIDIYLKYVGKLDVPMPELTPEELAEEER